MLLLLSYIGRSNFDSKWLLYLTDPPHSALGIPVNIVADVLTFNQLGISFTSAVAMDTAAYVILSALTITVTGLIVARLLLVRRRHTKLMGKRT